MRRRKVVLLVSSVMFSAVSYNLLFRGRTTNRPYDDEDTEELPSGAWPPTPALNQTQLMEQYRGLGTETWSALRKALPQTVPLDLMRWRYDRGEYLRSDVPACRQFPMPWSVQPANKQWQFFVHYAQHLYLYSAHYDGREDGGAGAVRVLGMIDRAVPMFNQIRCLLWYEGEYEATESTVSDCTQTFTGFPSNAQVNPDLLTCPLPATRNGGKLPLAVSLVTAVQDPTCALMNLPSNVLRVQRPEEPQPAESGSAEDGDRRRRFAVCVKGLFFLDPSVIPRLVEWMELLFILGADKIFVRYEHLEKRILEMFLHYQERRLVDLKPHTWAGPYPQENLAFKGLLRKNIKLMIKQDNIPYNDCMYRAMKTYDYVTILDIDEVIMPLNHDNWNDLMRHLEETSPGGTSFFSFPSAYFMDSMVVEKKDDEEMPQRKKIPEHMHMLKHTVRSRQHLDQLMKVMLRTDAGIKTTIGHKASSCFKGDCKETVVDVEVAHLAHYREGCQLRMANVCELEYRSDTVRDEAALRFADQLVPRVNNTLGQIGYFS